MTEAASAAETATAERNAIEAARNSLAGERSALPAELDRVRKTAEEDRRRLEAEIMEARRVSQSAKLTPTSAPAANEADASAGLDVHFKKPADWAEPLFVHYWDSGRRSAWPGEPMTAEGDGWFQSFSCSRPQRHPRLQR